MAEHVTIYEMAPRDGLQNEKAMIPTADKIKLVNMLSACSFSKIEVTAFVSPKWVPQMADAADVMQGIKRRAGCAYGVLTPNLRGLEDALAANADEVAVFASASEGFSIKNINCSVAESVDRFKPVIARAKESGVKVRGYISCVTDCPYDGPTKPEAVTQLAETLLEAGCYEISLGDTIGAGTPQTISTMLESVIKAVPASQLAGHFHDTHSNALGNIEIALDHGLRVFDAAAGGLGGCPYAPGAKGNVATEQVVALLAKKGFATGIDREKLGHAASFAQSLRN